MELKDFFEVEVEVEVELEVNIREVEAELEVEVELEPPLLSQLEVIENQIESSPTATKQTP